MVRTLPKGIMANTLNQRTRRVERGYKTGLAIPRLHVSSLIKSDPSYFFCEREFVLRYMEDRKPQGAGTPPKFELLYAVGHFYGDHLVNEFLRKNPKWADFAWGDWTCACTRTKVKRTTFDKVKNKTCKRCKQSVTTYVEVDLLNPKKTVVGHADLIFLVDGVFYIYEFKSIERADIVFSEINAPLGDHLTQASNYYYMLKSEGKNVSKQIRFVYIDRSMSGLYTELPYREVDSKPISADRLKRFYARAERVHRAIETKILPKRHCAEIGCARAKNCEVAISCFYRRRKKIKLLRIPTDADKKAKRTKARIRR